MLQRFAGAEPNDLDLLANLSPVPEEDDGEDDEESAAGVTAGRGDCLHEHQAGNAATHAGFCRDHRGKLQSVWELCEDVAPQDAQAARQQAQPMRQQAPITNRAIAQAQPVASYPQAQGRLLSETPWPADRLVYGPLELRGSARRRSSLDREVMCTIQHGKMTFRSTMHPGAEMAEMAVLAEVPISGVDVTIVPDQTRKFSISSGPENIDRTQVWCCAKDQEYRNKWLAVLHRLGVDLYCEYGGGE
ncbi:MAG: hypothetical protein ACPIOQ_77055, partial [Promethearchaeia archaeon]